MVTLGAGGRCRRKHNSRLNRMHPYVACQQGSRKAYIQGRVMDAHGAMVAYICYRFYKCYSACDHLLVYAGGFLRSGTRPFPFHIALHLVCNSWLDLYSQFKNPDRVRFLCRYMLVAIDFVTYSRSKSRDVLGTLASSQVSCWLMCFPWLFT